jgi:hypothetical protein
MDRQEIRNKGKAGHVLVLVLLQLRSARGTSPLGGMTPPAFQARRRWGVLSGRNPLSATFNSQPGPLGILIRMAFLSVAACRCPAADVVWMNPVNGNWNEASKWSGNQVPGAGDNVYITNNGTVSVQSGILQLSGGGTTTATGSFSLESGATLNFASYTNDLVSGSRVTGPDSFTVSGATVNLNGGFLVTGTLNFTAGTANFLGNYWISNNTVNLPSGVANFVPPDDGAGGIERGRRHAGGQQHCDCEGPRSAACFPARADKSRSSTTRARSCKGSSACRFTEVGPTISGHLAPQHERVTLKTGGCSTLVPRL